MKTNNILDKYLKIYLEQGPEAPAEEQPQQDAAPVQPETPSTELPENEKYIIKLLTNSFIFNPKIFDKNKQQIIANKIKTINGLVNAPISKIIDEIKGVLALDNSLRVESKTITLLQNYLKLVEQVADGTEPQPDSGESIQAPNQQAQPTNQQVTTPTEKNTLSLEEIFPLYKELILKALRHAPTEEELMILKPVANQFGETDPLKIVEAIQNLLSQSLEDKELKDNLSNA